MKDKRIDIIKKVYDKYKLTESLPQEAKDAILRSKKDVFIQVLKKQKKYSLFMALVTSLFFFVKKFGVTLSFIKAIIVTAIVSAVTVATVFVGSYYGIKKLIKNTAPLQIEKTKKEISQPKVLDKKAPASEVPGKKIINYSINIVPFEYEGITDKNIKNLENKIINNLNKLKGENTANRISRSKKDITARKILLGSVAKVDQTYFITIKVMNPGSSKVLLYINEDIASVDQVDQVCSRIARKLVQKLKL